MSDYYYYYYTAGNAPYINRFEAMNCRRGWSSLVVTQPSTSHHGCNRQSTTGRKEARQLWITAKISNFSVNSLS